MQMAIRDVIVVLLLFESFENRVSLKVTSLLLGYRVVLQSLLVRIISILVESRVESVFLLYVRNAKSHIIVDHNGDQKSEQ